MEYSENNSGQISILTVNHVVWFHNANRCDTIVLKYAQDMRLKIGAEPWNNAANS